MARTVPTAATVSPGTYETAALWNANVQYASSFLTGPPVFSGYQTTAQSIPNGVFTSFTIDTEVLDPDGGHSTVTNTSRYTATVPGVYLVIATAGWAANSTGYRRLRIVLNGAAIPGAAVGADATNAVLCGQSIATLAVMNGSTDFVEAQGAQSSGAALAAYNQDFAPSLRVFWISR
ncbi:hypothetical protein AB0H73_00270 [Streptomyces olivoreticuli]